MGDSGESVQPPRSEWARLVGIESAARWHYTHSACRGWPQGEVLALAFGLNPDSPAVEFHRLLDALGVEHDSADPLSCLLDGDS